MSTHEHRTGGGSGSGSASASASGDISFVQRTARTVVPFVTAFLLALFAAKVLGLVTDNPWARLATAVGVAVVSLLLHTYEEAEEEA
ncbi:hypothetical protein ACGFZK_29010 [Streptomyces sp. NPDC048257]|uniref:hypothetical protein n=1 Tax=Streptomyces sp. NPDC048257 TaxID=3365526 RepID=UPI0037199B7E